MRFLDFALNTLERTWALQCSPRPGRRGGGEIPTRGGFAGGGEVVGSTRDHLRLIWGKSRGRRWSEGCQHKGLGQQGRSERRGRSECRDGSGRTRRCGRGAASRPDGGGGGTRRARPSKTRSRRARGRERAMASHAARERWLARGRGCRARWINEDEEKDVGYLFYEYFCFFYLSRLLLVGWQ